MENPIVSKVFPLGLVPPLQWAGPYHFVSIESATVIISCVCVCVAIRYEGPRYACLLDGGPQICTRLIKTFDCVAV